MVLAAGGDGAQAGDALERLCATYWYPLYAFVRRQGKSAHDAQDLTQGFFARLLEKKDLAAVDRAKGKFRSFLLAAIQHYLANEWDRASPSPRGRRSGRDGVCRTGLWEHGWSRGEEGDQNRPEMMLMLRASTAVL